MLKNTDGQKWRVFAFTRADAAPVTGGAAAITCKVSSDYGAATALADVNPTEVEDGYYYFDLTQAETNYDALEIYPESSVSGVQVIGVPGFIRPSVDLAIKAKTDLISTGSVSVVSPVSATGVLDDLIIGDDYHAANGRAISWTVEPPSGTTVGGATCFFGGQRKAAIEGYTTEWLVEGTVSDAGGGLMTISFDLTLLDAMADGDYNWSAEIRNDASLESTIVRNDRPQTVRLIRKQT